MATIVKKPKRKNTIYDPTCGSGGMLIESAKYIQSHAEDSPKHVADNELKVFDRVIANPPFSQVKWWDRAEVEVKKDAKGKETAPNYTKSVSDPWGRFKCGVPPRSYGDLAFLQHMVSVLAHDGRMSIVLPHGVLFRGSSEGKIRQGILKADILEAVVGLPAKLFYNTGIPASILIINKSKAENLKKKVIFIDASSDFNFEVVEGVKIKKLPRYQQIRATNRTIEKLKLDVQVFRI